MEWKQVRHLHEMMVKLGNEQGYLVTKLQVFPTFGVSIYGKVTRLRTHMGWKTCAVKTGTG